MSKLLATLVSLVYYQTCFCDLYNGTELYLAFLVHRHGDRTPLENRVRYSNDQARLRELVEPYGFGQLTNEGINRAYEFGKFMRARYDQLLSPRYNKSQVYIRTTDSERTQMTVLAAMAAVYPPNERAWNPNLNWTPIPYTMVPNPYDPYLATHGCPRFKEGIENKLNDDSPTMAAFVDVYNELAEIGYDFRKTPLRIFEAYDTFVCQLGLGLPLDPRVQKMLPRIQATMDKAWDTLYGDENYIALQAGVLLHDFLTAADRAMSGQPTQKLRILSSHDFNVYSLIAVTRAIPRPGWPKYASMYALELRRVTATGQFVVLPVYLNSPGEDVQYLQVEGCQKKLCDIGLFKNLTSKYVLSNAEFRRECEDSEIF